MPTFTYDANSATRSFDWNELYDADAQNRDFNWERGKFHYLTIVLSNCLYNGNVFIADMASLESLVQDEFENITNLEFRGVGCSMVRGETDSLTIGVSAGFYADSANLTESEALSLRVASNTAITNISGLTVSEVRVESTLIQRSTY